MEAKTKPYYFIRFKSEYDTITDAERDFEFLDNRLGICNIAQIGYHIPQPQYKSWVPNFLIKLITKP